MRTAWLALAVVACGSPPAPAPPGPPAPPAAAAPAAPPPHPAPAPARRYPATARRPVTDAYGGVKVVDDYRWLEDARDPGVAAWVAAQNQLTRSRLDALPDRPRIRARIAALLSSKQPRYHGVRAIGGGVLALKDQPPKQQPMLVAFADPASAATERVVLDPNALDPSGKTAIDFFEPTRDGKRVAVSLSLGGSESGDVRVYDVATGAALPDVVARVNGGTAGGSLAWNAGGSGFWYTRYPHDGERPPADLDFYQQIYFHRLGSPTPADTYVLGKDFPRIAEIELRTSPDGRTVAARVANGDGGEFAFYAIDASAADRGETGQRTQQLFRFEDKVLAERFGPDGALYFVSRQGAPRGQVVRLRRPYRPDRPDRIELVVREGDGVIDELAVTASRLYLRELLGGPSRLRSVRITGGKPSPPDDIAAPFKVAAVGPLEPIGGDDVLYAAESYTATPGWYRYAPGTRRSAPTAMIQAMEFAMDDVEVVRETCTSADGTAVPINLLHRRGIALDGSHPALLYGYGGYSISLQPTLHPLTRFWIDQGGVYAEANLRGGNEFGEVWHDAGRLTRKQNVFDDFYACARALVDKRYTRPELLAINGRSNGGLLMGAALTQHPEMYRAVVSGVGIYDMLRVELSPNGAFNIPEYGTVKDPALFRALYAYSPYHRVTDGVAYPAVLLTTGANDPRVDPYHSRKMTARLQAATSSDRPILLRASADVGHGIGSPLGAVIDEAADSYAFVMHELGMRYIE
ncbi:MAG TPA: prolyl oligopeptidase family serine peptidase [Kofleriaceae bacterium]|jgi:prolyl oligopeptidase|nr:prolyl oligopeptidase family serine peptidase [Kofleriaceae bacterium]